jgi:uncharacterized protein (DUF486 family)
MYDMQPIALLICSIVFMKLALCGQMKCRNATLFAAMVVTWVDHEL